MKKIQPLQVKHHLGILLANIFLVAHQIALFLQLKMPMFADHFPHIPKIFAGQIIKPMALDVTLARGSCASFVQMPSPHHGVALLAQEMQGEVSVPWSDGIAMGWIFFRKVIRNVRRFLMECGDGDFTNGM
jgi:hypothetical protein